MKYYREGKVDHRLMSRVDDRFPLTVRGRTKATAQLQTVDEVIAPEGLPADAREQGWRFKGYADYVVQELVIEARNVRYRLEEVIRNCYDLQRNLFNEVIASFIQQFMPTMEHLNPQFHLPVNA
jgi:hypothetical protein